MSTVAEIEDAIRKLPATELRALQELIEEIMEDEMELSDQFKAKLARADAQLAAGEGRIRQPGE
jgi:hypothetical protein